MKARAIVCTAENTLEVRDCELREPEPDEVLVATTHSCISPGTEFRCLRGKQKGLVFPFVPGYALAGRVLRPDAAGRVKEGDRVACVTGSRDAGDLKTGWGGHISHAIVIPADLHVLPSEFELREGGLVRMAGIALHGVRRARPVIGERVLVIGLGIIGQLSARLFKLAGAEVLAVDRSEPRVAIARAAGIEAIAIETDMAADVGAVRPGGSHIIVDATGSPAVALDSVALLREVQWRGDAGPSNRYLVQGSYEGEIGFPYQVAFQREAEVIFTRDAQPVDYPEILRLVRSGDLQLRDLVSEVAPPDECQRVYDALRAPDTGGMTAVFEWA